MLNSVVWTLRKRGFKILFFATFYQIKISLFKFFKKKYIEKKIFNFKMLLDIYDKGLSRTLLLFGERELEQKFIIEKVLDPNDTVLDLGSNIGYYALIFLKQIEYKNLIVVEPSPTNFNLLIKNLKLNNFSNINSFMAAISDVDTKKEFYLSEMSNLNSFHVDKKNIKKYKKILVNSVSINTLLKGKKIDLIRMDVEGHEVNIFKSLLKYIDEYNYKPSILYEPHINKYNQENNIIEPLNKLFKLGYSLQVAASSSIEGTYKFTNRMYKPIKSFYTDEKKRDIFLNISNQDALELLSKEGGVRTAYLSCKNEHIKFN